MALFPFVRRNKAMENMQPQKYSFRCYCVGIKPEYMDSRRSRLYNEFRNIRLYHDGLQTEFLDLNCLNVAVKGLNRTFGKQNNWTNNFSGLQWKIRVCMNNCAWLVLFTIKINNGCI